MFRALLLALLLVFSRAEAVILYRTADPNENTSAPTGDLANSGWQYQGFWGGFLGTPIAPHYFVSAGHFGDAPEFSFNGITYHVVEVLPDPESDLKLVRVTEAFPAFAPLYSRLDEVGQRIAEFGRGTRRGTEVLLENVLKGWNWGPGDGVVRWGENVVSHIAPYGPNTNLLAATFDQAGLPNECHLSSGDSGGAAFINDAAVWKLAGINFAVDEVYTSPMPNASLTAALFDARGFYASENGGFVLIAGDNPVPTSFYATRISRRIPWIATVIANPVFTIDGNSVSLTYTRLVLPPSDVLYRVEQSSTLAGWSTSTATEEVISTNASTQLVKSTVDSKGSDVLFLRLRVSRP